MNALADEQRPFVREARRHLAAHLAEPFSLAALADAVGISPSHLRQAFTADVGVSPSAYLAALRVDRAADLLRVGRPIKEVAATVGFCDPSHLTRRFKRLRGVTPAQYAADPFQPRAEARGPLPLTPRRPSRSPRRTSSPSR